MWLFFLSLLKELKVFSYSSLSCQPFIHTCNFFLNILVWAFLMKVNPEKHDLWYNIYNCSCYFLTASSQGCHQISSKCFGTDIVVTNYFKSNIYHFPLQVVRIKWQKHQDDISSHAPNWKDELNTNVLEPIFEI